MLKVRVNIRVGKACISVLFCVIGMRTKFYVLTVVDEKKKDVKH